MADKKRPRPVKKVQTARSEWFCAECLGVIPIGVDYLSYTWVYRSGGPFGKPYATEVGRFHLRCKDESPQ